MHPILFKIGNFTFYTHGILAAAGIIAGAIITYWLAGKEKLSRSFLFDNIIFITLAGIIGARLTYFFLYQNQFKNLMEILFLWEGGMVSYGGFILGGLVYYWLLSAQKENIRKWFDVITPGFFLGMFFGRIGNLMAGEYSGVYLQKGFSINGAFPAPVYEAVLCLLLFASGTVYCLKNKKRDTGKLFTASFMIYGLVRFIIDYWRVESKIIFNLSAGQITDLLFFAIFLLSLFFIIGKEDYGIRS